jgi:hypothetical protein
VKKTLTFILSISFSIAFGQSNSLITAKISDINFEADLFLGFDQFGFQYFISNEVLHKIKNSETFVILKPFFGKNSQGRSAKSTKNCHILRKLQCSNPT